MDEYTPEVPFDTTHPRSIYNIVPSWVREVMHSVPPDLWFMDEQRLRHAAGEDSRINRIRLAFWSEYESAQEETRMINFFEVSRRCGIAEYFVKSLIKPPAVMAYIMRAPASYAMFLDEALERSLTRMREILELPIHKSDGTPDVQMSNTIIKIATFLDMRKNGAFVNRTLNVHRIQNENVEAQPRPTMSSTELDQKILELERKKQIIDSRKAPDGVRIPQIELVVPND